MNAISKTQKDQVHKKIKALKIERPDLTILEISSYRTKLVDELTFLEAQTLLERFNKVNQKHTITISS